MTKTPSPENATGLSEIGGRRAFLKRAAAVTVAAAAVGIPAALAGSDPIFAAITAYKMRRAEFTDACGLTDTVAAEQEGRTVSDADKAFYQFTSDREIAALETLANTVPQTGAGLRAVLNFFVEEVDLSVEEEGTADDLLRSILASPAISGGANV